MSSQRNDVTRASCSALMSASSLMLIPLRLESISANESMTDIILPIACCIEVRSCWQVAVSLLTQSKDIGGCFSCCSAKMRLRARYRLITTTTHCT